METTPLGPTGPGLDIGHQERLARVSRAIALLQVSMRQGLRSLPNLLDYLGDPWTIVLVTTLPARPISQSTCWVAFDQFHGIETTLTATRAAVTAWLPPLRSQILVVVAAVLPIGKSVIAHCPDNR